MTKPCILIMEIVIENHNRIFDKTQVPEIKDVIMCMTDNEVRHRIIYSHFSNRFPDSTSMLQIKGVGLHPLKISFLTEDLSESNKYFFVMYRYI